MVLLVTRYVIKREKKEATKQEKEIQATTFKRIQFQKGKGILKLSSKSRIWSVERKPGDRFMNQDIQVLTALMKMDYPTLNILTIDFEI